MENSRTQGNVEEFHLPEWETTARHRGEKHGQTGRSGGASNVKEWAFTVFDRVMPGHGEYFGFSRNAACIAIMIAFFILLALTLGLAIGLSKKSRYASAPT